MAKVDILQDSFTAGELTPLLEGQVRYSKYYSGCRRMENMIPTVQGPVRRRPGTEYIASTKGNGVALLVPFEFSINQSYILEFGDGYIRFSRNGGQILDGVDPYEITSSYVEADLFELQFVQSADVMFDFHGTYAPRKLSRTGHTAWALETVDWKDGPFLTENDTDTTISASAVAKDAAVTLTASAATFLATNQGGLYRIIHILSSSKVSGDLTAADQYSSELTVIKGQKWDLITDGFWDGTIKVQKKYDDDWITVYETASPENTNERYNGQEITESAVYRVYMTAQSSGTCEYNLIARTYDVKGVVKINSDGFRSTTIVVGVIQSALASDATDVTTKRWSEGAWSDRRGWPSCVTFFEQRLFAASTSHQPTTLWGSVSADYENMLAGPLADDAIIYTPAVAKQNPIQWIEGHNVILAGTIGGELTIGASNRESPMGPTNPPTCIMHSTYGSDKIQGIRVNDVQLFLQRDERKVREMVFALERDKFVAPDLTRRAEHITRGGIKNWAFQKHPTPILWCVRKDGVLLSFTYEREEDVLAWSRHILGGTDAVVESVSVIPSSDTSETTEDEVWFIVKRTINGSTVRHIERMKPWDWGDDQKDCFFVDDGLTYDGDATTIITGLDHLEGEEVAVLADGGTEPNKTVVGGSITLINAASKVHVGPPYTPWLQPMKPEMPMQGGTILGRTKRIYEVMIKFYKTLGCLVGPDEDNLERFVFAQTPVSGEPTELSDDDKFIPFPGGFEKSGNLLITQDKPLPLCVRAILMRMEINE